MLRSFFLKTLNKYASKWVVILIDIFLVCLTFVLAYSIKFEATLSFDFKIVLKQIPLIAIIAFISFLIVGSYKGIIRHTGTKDAFNIFLALTIFSFTLGTIILFINIFNIYKFLSIPRSIILIHYFLSIFLLIISRYVFKAFFEVVNSEIKSIKNVLIYGAGDSGIITYGALNKDSENNYDVLGFIDDNKNKIGKKIDRIKIYDSKKIDQNFIEKNNIKEIIISIQKAKSSRLLEITEKFLDFAVEVKIVPPLTKWIGGSLNVNQIKQVNIDDLLGREQINLDNPFVERKVANKTILVTGAAGSIGSEISRQLATYNIENLILIDQAESALYDLQQELVQNNFSNFTAIVADVRDRYRMECVFQKYKPNRVFHAAAYKHVPLMENSPYEAVKINILGTKNIADLALKYACERFVMVSTDKAVNPTNVMGATKRVAEMYISSLSDKSAKTKFTTTRFGNVLGSNGSVIPLFKKQIETGGPLTVTHRDITRFFMTIPEACKLVLEAGTMGEGGEIYIFDMGESVKIFDLAKRMISLSNLKYPDDIDIVFTGLRPGEKLFEELLADGENTIKTYHEKIMIAKTQKVDSGFLFSLIKNLYNSDINLSNEEIVKVLKKLVPEFISNNSVYEKLDQN